MEEIQFNKNINAINNSLKKEYTLALKNPKFKAIVANLKLD